VKLFDHDYHRIFSRHLDAHKVLVLYLLDAALLEHRGDLSPELNAAFSSVRFTLAHLVFQLIGLTPQGEAFLADPSGILTSEREALIAALAEMTGEAVESANYFVEAKETEAAEAGETFDPKVVFKSRTGVTGLERDAVSHARRMVRRDDTFGFRLTPS
jgi:hypothetical protein